MSYPILEKIEHKEKKQNIKCNTSSSSFQIGPENVCNTLYEIVRNFVLVHASNDTTLNLGDGGGVFLDKLRGCDVAATCSSSNALEVTVAGGAGLMTELCQLLEK